MALTPHQRLARAVLQTAETDEIEPAREQQVLDAYSALSENDRNWIEMHYGLRGVAQSLEDIATAFRVPVSEVEQTVARGLEQIRAGLNTP